jgi:hypothetical protein
LIVKNDVARVWPLLESDPLLETYSTLATAVVPSALITNTSPVESDDIDVLMPVPPAIFIVSPSEILKPVESSPTNVIPCAELVALIVNVSFTSDVVTIPEPFTLSVRPG